MSDEKALALRLADDLGIDYAGEVVAYKAAAELRRLHEVEQQRDELLAALKMALPQLIGRAEQTARAVIEKAEGAK